MAGEGTTETVHGTMSDTPVINKKAKCLQVNKLPTTARASPLDSPSESPGAGGQPKCLRVWVETLSDFPPHPLAFPQSPWLLPGCDEVLSQSDADWGACDGHVTFSRTFRLVPNLDMRSRHLPNLTDFAALAANDAANELSRRQERISLYHRLQSNCF